MNVVEKLSSILLKLLPRAYFLKVRSAYFKLKKKASPLLRLVYGTFTTDELIAEIDSRLDRDWRILMVHSSVNNLHPMYTGSALELLKALIDYCGPDRTLVMPTFNFGENEEGTRGMLQKNPRFDLRRTPSQMGLLTELFRRSRGVVQSRHPGYRVAALGPLAEQLTAGHEHAPSGMGKSTPFDFMAQHKAQIIGIGKTFQVMTQVHHVESLLDKDWPAPQNVLPNIPVTIVDKQEEIAMELGGVQQRWTFNIWKLREIMSSESLKEWRFHNCPMFAARADEVTDTLVAAAARGFTLYDPPKKH
ncbi:MAG: AAC(3) family N-acetyltransferase [Halioglobus sp.]|nr:AAC(3) family N-acetyltransferase [Halioglobus sp.]